MAGDGSVIIIAETAGGPPAAGDVHAGPPAGTTTAVEMKEAFPPFDPSTFANQLIWLAVSFLVLYLVASRIALPKIGGIIDTRRKRIEGDLAEADKLRRETDQAVATYEATLAAARASAQKVAEDTRLSVRNDIDAKRKAAEESLSAHMADAEKRIQQTKTAALANVDAIAAEAAQALVERLMTRVTADEAAAAVAKVKVTP
ncbi:MAG: F0F1 ATP synthase subunit B' [Devosia sp.]|nr:F0F1 ATP synthase subunit B' [Devosia sp.]